MLMTSVKDFKVMKERGEKISMLTVSDYTIARLFNASPVDSLLVGDSLAMVVHGFSSTVHATVDMMASHTAAVSRGTPDKFIVADMPFPSFRQGRRLAMKAVDALMKAGASAVKLEGVRGHADTVAHIVESGVPVMGHLGLTPQSMNVLGGHKVQGKTDRDAEKIFDDALQLEQLGCFGIVLECIPMSLAGRISEALSIPTIGIGAGPHVDGQVLVWQDMLGLTDIAPRFLKHFLNGKKLVADSVAMYCQEVKDGQYPGLEHSYK